MINEKIAEQQYAYEDKYFKLEDKLYKKTYGKIPFIHSMSPEFLKFDEKADSKEILKDF